eukprot:493108_1
MDPASSSKDNMFGFDDPELSDKVLVLIEGEGDDQQTTKVHVTRLALCFRSEYFRNLFGQKFAEAKCDEVVLKLEDGETEPMMDLLKFIYSMMCNLSLQSDTLKEKSTMEVVQILMLADRYMFEAIESNNETELNIARNYPGEYRFKDLGSRKRSTHKCRQPEMLGFVRDF